MHEVLIGIERKVRNDAAECTYHHQWHDTGHAVLDRRKILVGLYPFYDRKHLLFHFL